MESEFPVDCGVRQSTAKITHRGRADRILSFSTRNELCVGSGPGKDMFQSTQIIGQRQVDVAMELYETVGLLDTGCASVLLVMPHSHSLWWYMIFCAGHGGGDWPCALHSHDSEHGELHGVCQWHRSQHLQDRHGLQVLPGLCVLGFVHAVVTVSPACVFPPLYYAQLCSWYH